MAVVASLDDVASMGQPIKQRRGHLRIAEHGAPFAEGQVGGDDQRDTLVEFADQMEQERATILRERQVAEFIENDGILVEQAVRSMPGASRAFLGIELVHEIDDTVEARSFARRMTLRARAVARCDLPVPVPPTRTILRAVVR